MKLSKKCLLVGAALVSLNGAVRAATQAYQLSTLNTSSSVTVGPYTYSNFASTTTDVDTSTVTVTFSSDPGVPNLELLFAPPFTDSSTVAKDLLFTYDLAAPSITSATLAIGGTVTGDASANVTEAIYDPSQPMSNGPIDQINVSVGANPTLTEPLGASYTHLHFEKSIEISGGGPGTATVLTVDNSVPEPASVALGAVFAGGLLIRRRRQR